MDELDDRRKLDMALGNLSHGRRCEQCQQGPQALTAGFNDVLTNVFDHVDIGMQLLNNQLIDAAKIRLNTGS